MAEKEPPRPLVYPDPRALLAWTHGGFTANLGQYGEVNLNALPTGFGRRGETVEENRRKQGIFHHTLLVARATAATLSQLEGRCEEADASLGYSIHLISHLGTIPTSELIKQIREGTIPVDDPAQFLTMPMELIGKTIVEHSRVPRRVWRALKSFSSLGKIMDPDHPDYPKLPQLVADYWDHRITDHVWSLAERMADFVKRNHVAEGTSEKEGTMLVTEFMHQVARMKAQVQQWHEQQGTRFVLASFTQELVDRVISVMKETYGDSLVLLSRGNSFRHIVMLTALDVQTEVFLERMGINTQSNTLPPMPTVEWYLRLLFIDRTTPKVFREVRKRRAEQPEKTVDDILRQMFPSENHNTTWWDDSMREKYTRYAGKHPQKHRGQPGAEHRRHRGPRRGIVFLSSLQKKQGVLPTDV